MAPLWLTMGLCPWETSRLFMVLPPLKWVWMPYLSQIFLMLSQQTLCVGYDNVTLVFSLISGRLGTCGAPISSLSGGLVKSFLHLVPKPTWDICILVRAFLRWSFSFWSSSGLLHTVEALWERVWITLNLAER